MKNCLALLIFAMMCACHGQTQVFRTLRTLTARPFKAQELRVLFANCGKQVSTVQQPGICPEKWIFPEKAKPYTTALLMWNSVFDVASQGKYTFRLSEPDVCSALYVDGNPVASWKESFPPMPLAEGTHSIQMLVAQRPAVPQNPLLQQLHGLSLPSSSPLCPSEPRGSSAFHSACSRKISAAHRIHSKAIRPWPASVG